MRIGELSARTGCPVPRIRFYEQRGVLKAPMRTAGGQREYSQEDLRRLDFIMSCRSNGMKLECIERFLQFADDPSLGTQWLQDRLDEYLEHIEEIRARLDRLEAYLRQLRERFPSEDGAMKPRDGAAPRAATSCGKQ